MDFHHKPVMLPLLLSAFLTLAGFSCRQPIRSDLPVAQLQLGGKKFRVEVANRPATRQAGLMFRKELGEDDGMIFVFPDSAIRAFWMKNTYIPLSIAYLDGKGAVLNILEMPPQTERSFFSEGPASYAVEMNSGWFGRNGVKPGDRVLGLEKVPGSRE